MNSFISALILFCFSFISTQPYQKVEDAFRKGNAQEVIALATPKILLSIDGNEGAYSKSQATQILDSFFKKNPPRSFSFNFKGKEKRTASFAVAKYHSKNGKRFQVSMKFKKTNNTSQIESIKIFPS